MDSLWKQYLKPQSSKTCPAQAHLDFDVVIVGAGIAGLLTGYFLSQSGLRIALLEEQTACSGVTLYTTAKITLAPRLFYHKLLNDLGYQRAKQYVTACHAALSTYDSLITSQKIACDYETLPMYLYSTEIASLLDKEQNAAVKLGIHATLENSIELPFRIKNAIRYENQAQFNPIKFLNAIKKDLPIYEHTQVTEIKKIYSILQQVF